MKQIDKKYCCLVASSFIIQIYFSTIFADESIKKQILIEQIEHAIFCAENNKTKLPAEIFLIEGMSGKKTKIFLNELCSMKNATYLEIGLYRGSTFIAALYGNDSMKSAYGIDNWLTFDTSPKFFLQNYNKYLKKPSAQIFANDCFSLNLTLIQHPIQVYFYDGDHTFISHEKSFTYFNSAFNNIFVAIIDDWNWEFVRNGSFSAFEKLKYKILYSKEIFTEKQDSYGWWNGLYIAVIQK